MTKIFVKMETGYCGSEGHEVIDVDYTEEELADPLSPAARNVDTIAHEMARENYQMYGFDENTEFEEDEFSGYWEIYNPEKHNDYLTQCQIDELEQQ